MAAEPDDPRPPDAARLLDSPHALRSVYQPIVDLRTGECSGFRAFVRVADSPGRSPRAWFAAATAAGLGGRLEAAGLRVALGARGRLGPGRLVVVALSARFAADPEVVDVLRSQPDPHLMVVELSPHDGPVDPAQVLALRDLGVGVACRLTDAGLPEIRRVVRLRPDLVTVGAALVRGIAGDPLLGRLARLAAAVAADVGAAVVGTGLEDLDDARQVQELGFAMGQGWLFGRPRPSPAAPEDALVRWIPAAWQDLVAGARVARLARPAPPDWRWQCDSHGRLLTLTTPQGQAVPAGALPRLRATLDLRAAAGRLADGLADSAAGGLVLVVDTDGRYLGVTDRESVLVAALRRDGAAGWSG